MKASGGKTSIESSIERARRLAAKAPVLKATRPLFDRAVQYAARKRGVTLAAPAGDSFRFDASLFRNSYENHEPEVYAWVMGRLEPGSTFFDIGAWIGLFTLGAARRVGPQGRVVAFEPSAGNAGLLRRHVELNELEDRTVVVEALVGDATGNAPFFAAPGPDMENSIVARPGATREELPMTTVDAVVAETGDVPDVLKIDVEGAEYRVLLGAKATMAEHRPVIVCAIHTELLRALGDSPEQVASLAGEVGYSLQGLDGRPVSTLTDTEILMVPQ
ncbi:MAG: FkbM family methyltransferase [Actinomycetota bacterium]|nr:FkbM family methyltransferase [Actinomycetota bacterium]